MQRPAKRQPVRMCAGCSQHREKREMVRVVRSPAGEISLDLTGKKPGRGAYICRSAECLAKARKARRIERVFGCPIPDEVYDHLLQELQQAQP